MDKRIIRVFLLFCPAATSTTGVSCCSSYSPPPPRHLLSSAAVVDVDVDDVDLADDVDVDVDDVVPPIHHLHPDLSSSAAVFALIENCSSQSANRIYTCHLTLSHTD